MRLPSNTVFLAAVSFISGLAAAEESPFAALGHTFEGEIAPLVSQYCTGCHSTEKQKGELDLERFSTLSEVRSDPSVWKRVIEQLADGEMPPEDEPQPSDAERETIAGWAQAYLDAEALAGAGDPGRVVLRRLSNSEYERVLRDLTGLAGGWSAEFPADGAAGEGFTNTGQALVMSPALIEKYFAAAKDVAEHAMLLPDGFRFSAGTTRRDREDALLAEIRAIQGRWVNAEGRVDLERYFAELLRLRTLGSDSAPVDNSSLSPRYAVALWQALRRPSEGGLLLDSLRARFRNAAPEDAAALAAWVRSWQDALFRFNTVGHFRDWQEPVDPVAEEQEFRLELEPRSGEAVQTLYLVTSAVVEDSGADDKAVRWKNARLEGAGRSPVTLAEAGELLPRLIALREDALARTEAYLKAAADALAHEPEADVAELAARYGLHPGVLEAWMIYLGVAGARAAPVDGLFDEPLRNVGGYEFVSGWGSPDTPSIVANSSGGPVRIPGNLRARSVAMHPAPAQFVAVAWRSPLSGTVRVESAVSDAHPECGNGVDWSLELRRGVLRRPLASGSIGTGQTANIAPIPELPVREGDLLSLIIGPRDGNHVCDLSAVDLIVFELGGEMRQWNLSEEVSEDILAGNPHDDRYGNPGGWLFYRGELGSEGLAAASIPAGSQPARWLDADGPEERMAISKRMEQLLAGEIAPESEDTAWVQSLRRLDGPLFGDLDPAGLPDAPAGAAEGAGFGADPGLFQDGDIVSGNTAIVELRWPSDWVGGREFVVSAVLEAGADGAVQCSVETAMPELMEGLRPGIPILARQDGRGREAVQRALNEFRALFPAVFCYPQIVPVDEVITLVLFHREDEHLRRLLLEDTESARLDRLWKELRFVSEDAVRIDAIFDDFMGYASQEGQTARFEPLREPIRQGAKAQREERRSAESPQLEELLRFAGRAWRKPLATEDEAALHALYREERAAGLEHEEAFRAVLARVLVSPRFLYKVEEPADGSEAAPVDAWELASRLSFFLWSTLPDEEVFDKAQSGALIEEDELLGQTRRMLADARARALAVEFAAQWLGVRDFDEHDEKNETLFPRFAELRGPMDEEVTRFFEDLFCNNGSLLSIFEADHSFVNGELAAHYGLPTDGSGDWTRVEGMRALGRGGVLGMGAVLAKQSGASRTSPVLRGTWVVETLLGEDLPNPPPNVPQIPDDGSDTSGLSVRQLTERHRSVAECAECHQRIDPYGFALEGFDAIGAWREKDESGHAVDTNALLRDGTSFSGLDGLRAYLQGTRKGDWTRQFCRKLLGFALGRSVTLSDEPLLDEMLAALEAGEWRVWTAIETVVKSRQFRYHRGKDDES